MMKKIMLLGFALVLTLGFVYFVSAGTTITVVGAAPANDVTINVINPNSGDLYASYTNVTDSSGTLTYIFEPSASKLNINVAVRKNGKILAMRTYENKVAGGTITLNPFEVVAVATNTTNTTTTNTTAVNVTANVTTNTVVANNTQSPSISDSQVITGAATNNSSSSFFSGAWDRVKSIPTRVYYIILGAIVVLVLIFFAVRYIMKNGLPKPSFGGSSYRDSARPEIRSQQPAVSPRVVDKELAEAERKIREAQADIDRIRNRKSRISEAERKFQEAQRELERARKGF